MEKIDSLQFEKVSQELRELLESVYNFSTSESSVLEILKSSLETCEKISVLTTFNLKTNERSTTLSLSSADYKFHINPAHGYLKSAAYMDTCKHQNLTRADQSSVESVDFVESDTLNEEELFDCSCVEYFSEIYMHLITDHPLNEDEISNVSGCLGYALRQVLYGDDLSDPEVIQTYTSPLHSEIVIRYEYDSMASNRTDPQAHFVQAFDLAKEYIFDGTPVRKTDQQGPGTRGTRLVQGIGRMAPDGNDAALVSFLVR